ncbi:MAG: pitrilysin family protein [Balneolaceae bacterium]|nr:pitrilysin family protein [Balneolaceae bacterium]
MKTSILRSLPVLAVLVLLTGTQPSDAQSLQEFEQKVTEFTLDNGLTFVVVNRPVAPVVSFVTFVDVGAANEPVGHTGIAHIFEHMAFKGTHEIGTSNWEAEQDLLEEMDAVYQEWLQESYSPSPDSARMEELMAEFNSLQEEAGQYVVNNQFSEIVSRNGGTGMNASTSADQTMYFYSLPENRAELWFSLESARFKNPVFREFYKEKDAVREERRARESQPTGRLVEEFLAVAYTAHPYGRSIIGWPSDITATTMEDTREFYETYYVPSNITIGIAGDITADRARELAETYFGDIPRGPEPPPVYTKEPEQLGKRQFTIREQSQPVLLMGYHAVAQDHPDFDDLQLLGAVISQGRTSRLYKRMVEEEQLALGVQALNGFPGTKFETMFMTLAIPNQGVSVDTLQSVIHEEIEKVKQGVLTQEELDRARTNIRAGLIRSLDSNMGLAQSFAAAEAQRGDWRTVFTGIDDLQEVTLEDLQRVARTYLTEDNLTVGTIEQPESDTTSADNTSR